eukprot:6477773-Amphidinium_carterae.1
MCLQVAITRPEPRQFGHGGCRPAVESVMLQKLFVASGVEHMETRETTAQLISEKCTAAETASTSVPLIMVWYLGSIVLSTVWRGCVSGRWH